MKHFLQRKIWKQKTAIYNVDKKVMKRKIGRVFLAAGIIILLVALLLLFNTNSPWALITLALSIILNTIGLSALMVRSVRDGADDD